MFLSSSWMLIKSPVFMTFKYTLNFKNDKAALQSEELISRVWQIQTPRLFIDPVWSYRIPAYSHPGPLPQHIVSHTPPPKPTPPSCRYHNLSPCRFISLLWRCSRSQRSVHARARVCVCVGGHINYTHTHTHHRQTSHTYWQIHAD